MPIRQTAEILPTDSPDLFKIAVRQAVELLRSGQVVALPTETVYGLAANALDARAVSEIYAIKGRPALNPIIVHVASLEMARRCAADFPEAATKLATAFWPGPLTLVLSRAKAIPDIVTAGGPTVGVRWPSHPFIQAVIRECGFPLAAPSANPSNTVSPTSADHVRRQLGEQLPLIVDGGSCQVGIESTVLDLTVSPPAILRPGMIQEPTLRAVIGEVRSEKCEVRANKAARSPGQLRKHYSPRAKLIILEWKNDGELRQQLKTENSKLKTVFVIAHSHIPSTEGFGSVSVIPHDPEAFARAIYAELHRCDEEGAELIVVETPSDTVEWQPILDRLMRAAAD
jgi:L-threonylcarbamoyladenylate synthase